MPGRTATKDPAGRTTRIRTVVERCAASDGVLDAGEIDALVRVHADLMPELGVELAMLARIRRARVSAEQTGSSSTARGEQGAFHSVIDKITGYQVLGEIHRGGQGVVYEAIRISTQLRVAIKVMRDGPLATPGERARFDREVNLLAALDHPNIVVIHDSGNVAGHSYFVMDFVPGQPLSLFMSSAARSIEQTLRLFAKICDAVNAAHVRGIIHRDLKPANIRIDERGEPYILDFGLAKVGGNFHNPTSTAPDGAHISTGQVRQSADHHTLTGQFVGSLPWSAPEQVDGRSNGIETRTDVYGLGVVLYQMLTGHFPYEVVGPMHEVVQRIISAVPHAPRKRRRDIDDELETIVLKCLSKEPPRRYQTAGELGRDVERYMRREPIDAKRDSHWYVLQKTLLRYRGRVAGVFAFVLLTVGSAVALTVLYARQTILLHERDDAARQAQAELANSRTIAKVAQEMLSGIDPDTAGGLDKQLMRRVLDKAAVRVDAELVGQPEIEAALRHTIGCAYHGIGDFSAAQPHLERALELRRSLSGDLVGLTVTYAMHLGNLYVDQGRYALAEPLLIGVIESNRRARGPEHVETLRSIGNLALLYKRQERRREAESLLREALDSSTRGLGAEHSTTLASMTNLASLLTEDGRLAEAQALHERALELERRTLGERHSQTLTAMNSLAVTYQLQGKCDQAENLQRNAIDGLRFVMGEFHPLTLQCEMTLAAMVEESGKLAEAQTLLQNVLEAQRRVLGKEHPDLSEALFHLASLAMKQGQPANAEPLYRECLERCENSLPAEHSKIACARIKLGEAILRQRRFEEAEPYLLSGYASSLGARVANADVWSVAARTQLTTLYELWDVAEPGTGKAAKAAQWRVESAGAEP